MKDKKLNLAHFKAKADKKLELDKIYTSWPLNDRKEFGSITDYKSSLFKYYPDLK